jgi:hypothetical protein
MPLRLEDLIETFSPQSTWTKRCIYEALRTAYEPRLAEGGAPYLMVLVFLITGDWNSSVGEILPRARIVGLWPHVSREFSVRDTEVCR